MYALVTGPLAWLAFGIFIIGMIVRIIAVLRLSAKKDKVVFNHFNLAWSLRSICRSSTRLPRVQVTSIRRWIVTASFVVYRCCTNTRSSNTKVCRSRW